MNLTILEKLRSDEHASQRCQALSHGEAYVRGQAGNGPWSEIIASFAILDDTTWVSMHAGPTTTQDSRDSHFPTKKRRLRILAFLREHPREPLPQVSLLRTEQMHTFPSLLCNQVARPALQVFQVSSGYRPVKAQRPCFAISVLLLLTGQRP